MKMEHRTSAGLIEFREAEESNVFTIQGLAIPYNRESEIMWGFKEIIAKGAFSNSLSGDIRCLWSHDTGKPLGRTLNNTLSLRDTDEGLFYECTLPGNSWGLDAKISIKRGDVTGTSFGFMVLKDSWAVVEGSDIVIRTIHEGQLFEVSPVAFPAYPDSSVEARSKLLEEGFKKAFASREIPLEIYKRKLNLQKMIIGGI